jgi:hypothetical protein
MVQLLVRLAQVVKALLVEITQEQFPHTGVVAVEVLVLLVRLAHHLLVVTEVLAQRHP